MDTCCYIVCGESTKNIFFLSFLGFCFVGGCCFLGVISFRIALYRDSIPLENSFLLK